MTPGYPIPYLVFARSLGAAPRLWVRNLHRRLRLLGYRIGFVEGWEAGACHVIDALTADGHISRERQLALLKELDL